jgi:hypothetical protein
VTRGIRERSNKTQESNANWKQKTRPTRQSLQESSANRKQQTRLTGHVLQESNANWKQEIRLTRQRLQESNTNLSPYAARDMRAAKSRKPLSGIVILGSIASRSNTNRRFVPQFRGLLRAARRLGGGKFASGAVACICVIPLRHGFHGACVPG